MTGHSEWWCAQRRVVCVSARVRGGHTFTKQRVCGSDGLHSEARGARMDILVPWTRQAEKVVSLGC